MGRGRWTGLGVALCVMAGAATWIVARRIPGKQGDGFYLVETGQTLTPVGKLVTTAFSRPKDCAVSPDGHKVAVLATDGVRIYDKEGKETDRVDFSGAALGIAWAPDGQHLFAAQGNGYIALLTKAQSGWSRRELIIDLPGMNGNPQGNGLAVSADGKRLYVALGVRNAVAEADATTGHVLRTIATDAAPYHLMRDGSSLYVACRGGAIASADDTQSAKSAGTRIRVDPRTDAAALGTVQRIDLTTLKAETIVKGRQPGAMLAAKGGLYVAMSDEDTVVYVRGGRVERALIRPEDDAHFGQIPTGLAMAPDGGTLYVSLGGANAVAVCDVKDGIVVKGYLPTAWYPIDVDMVGSNMVVSCAKGIGSRVESKNPGDATGKGIKFQPGLYYIHNNVGALQFVAPGDFTNLQAQTQKVAKNNAWGKELAARAGVRPVPVPERLGEPSVFKHVVYIIKENMSYDSVLGDVREGNGRPDLCMFPELVSPNHHQLARDFVLLDNTYVSGTNSADGHQWTSSGVANDYSERNYSAYTRSYPYDGGDPLAFSPKGFIWNAAIKSGKSVRVYGEFVDRPVVRNKETGGGGTFKEIWDDYKSKDGKFDIHAETSQKSLESVMHPKYIGFPSSVSDQWRADQFLGDLAAWDKSGAMPALCVLLLPNDHTVGMRPDFPTPWASVADNDLAFGRIVEALTKSKFWGETLILCIEDDCQLGIDHVDGHRTPAFVVSPYTKRGAVVSEMYTTVSFLRTIGLVLGLPAMTRFDRAANPLRECFVSKQDLSPFTRRPNRIPLDEYTPKPTKLQGRAKELALASSKLDWSDVDRADADVVAQAAWFRAFGNKPFPWASFNPNPDPDDVKENERIAERQKGQ